MRAHRTVAVAIPGRYPVQARASHFRPVADIAKIVIMVGGRLLRRGMAPFALWRSLHRAHVLPGRHGSTANTDASGPIADTTKAHAR
jgi:hypothetical protein